MNLQSQRTQDAFYLRKHKASGGVGTARILHEKHGERRGRVIRGTLVHIYIYSQDEGQAHFTGENTTISPGLAPKGGEGIYQ